MELARADVISSNFVGSISSGFSPWHASGIEANLTIGVRKVGPVDGRSQAKSEAWPVSG
jgi:hypothetical protein